MAIIGIDLGTTNSLVTVWKDGKINLIENAFGHYLTPSVVSLDGDIVYVGEVAKERLVTHPNCTKASFKRLMGGSKKLSLGQKKFLPEELSALVLRQLKEDAERYLGEAVEEAVISVPAYFNDNQRQATKEAGLLAGLKVERLVNEPSAAALAGRTVFDHNNEMLLIIDLGGGTFDVSLVECFENVVNVLAVSGDNHIGGNDFDLAIVQWFCEKNNLIYDKLEKSIQGIILKTAELCKIELSKQKKATMIIDTDKVKAKNELTRMELVKICGNLFARMQKPISKVLADGGITVSDINQVILVGGGCKIKIVSQFMQHIFDEEVLSIVKPDEIVAMGVGIYAGIKARDCEIKELVLMDICPFSLGVGVTNGATNDLWFSPVIERNTVLPASKTSRFQTTTAFQKHLELQVYQGEECYAKDNLLLEIFNIVLPGEENEEVDVCFTYDINGILEVEIEILSSGRKGNMVVLSGSGKKLSEIELKNKLLELEDLKRKSKEDEQIQLLIEMAQSLYAQTSGEIRAEIEVQIYNFLRRMKTQSKIKQREILEKFSMFLVVISSQLAYQPISFSNFVDSSWYEDFEDEEDDHEVN